MFIDEQSFLTEKLVNSIYQHIPYFKGDILIVDNGSTVEELSILQNLSDRIPLNIRVVELGNNFGVSGGRNKTLEHIKTEWAMFLDNDIYFINNPLPRLQNDISRLGCHFINMPLLDSDGEALFANGGMFSSILMMIRCMLVQEVHVFRKNNYI